MIPSALGSGSRVYILHSHDPNDRIFVKSLLCPALNLSPELVHCSNDIEPGTPILVEIERSIQASQVVLVVLSPAFLTQRWSELGETLASYHAVHGGRLIPILYADCNVPLRLRFREWLDCRDPERRHEALARLRELFEAPPPTTRELPCPYPGMLPYAAEDAALFGGRRAEIDEVVSRIAGGQRELYLVGPSGSGKTSLLQAGILPRLQRETDAVVGEPFQIHALRPGVAPTEGLAAIVTAVRGATARTLVVIDPLEELFTLVAPEEREGFQLGLEVLRTFERCHLLFALRADFLEELLRSPAGPHARRERQVPLRPLASHELQQALRAPAAQVKVQLTAPLLQRLLADADDEPGALPLLQHTLVHLWNHREHDYLGVEQYEALGSAQASAMTTALTTHADAALDGFDEEELAIARRVFLRLTALGEGRSDTRRQRTRSLLRAHEPPEPFDRVLQRLIDRHLLVASRGLDSAEPCYDLAHEVLISAWAPLRRWLAEHRHHEHKRRELEELARQWRRRVQAGMPDADPLGDGQLAELETWLTPELRQLIGLGEESEALIAASKAASDARRAAKEAEVQRLRDDLVRLHLLQGQSWLHGGRGARAAPHLISAREHGADDLPLRMLFHWARRALPRYIARGAATAMAWSPSGLHLALATSGGVRLWMPHLDQATFLSLPAEITRLAWSLDGRHLAAATPTALWLLTPSTGERLGPLEPHHAPLPLLAWSPDALTPSASPCGRYLAVAEEGHTARVRDALTSRAVSPLLELPAPIAALAWSPDGTHLATLCLTAGAFVWAPVEPSWLPAASPNAAPSLPPRRDLSAISPDGALAATAEDKRIRLHHHAPQLDDQPAARSPLSSMDHKALIVALAWSPDGALLASASADHRVRVWDPRAGYPLTPELEHPGVLQRLSWSTEPLLLHAHLEDAPSKSWPIMSDDRSLDSWRRDLDGQRPPADEPR
jgi:TIR domain/WD domain, G-beta repeat